MIGGWQVRHVYVKPKYYFTWSQYYFTQSAFLLGLGGLCSIFTPLCYSLMLKIVPIMPKNYARICPLCPNYPCTAQYYGRSANIWHCTEKVIVMLSKTIKLQHERKFNIVHKTLGCWSWNVDDKRGKALSFIIIMTHVRTLTGDEILVVWGRDTSSLGMSAIIPALCSVLTYYSRIMLSAYLLFPHYAQCLPIIPALCSGLPIIPALCSVLTYYSRIMLSAYLLFPHYAQCLPIIPALCSGLPIIPASCSVPTYYSRIMLSAYLLFPHYAQCLPIIPALCSGLPIIPASCSVPTYYSRIMLSAYLLFPHYAQAYLLFPHYAQCLPIIPALCSGLPIIPASCSVPTYYSRIMLSAYLLFPHYAQCLPIIPALCSVPTYYSRIMLRLTYYSRIMLRLTYYSRIMLRLTYYSRIMLRLTYYSRIMLSAYLLFPHYAQCLPIIPTLCSMLSGTY